MEKLKLSTKPLTTPHVQNHLWVPQSSRILCVHNKKDRTFSFTVTCKLKTSKGKKINKKKKISWPDSGGAPPLLERKKAVETTTKNNADDKVLFKKVPERVLGVLSNLNLAIGDMFAVAGLMALGSSIIEQGEVPEFFFQNFPQDHPLFGFFSWERIFTLSLDHIFSSPVFPSALALLGASLMASTYAKQISLVKVAKRQSFSNSAETIHKKEDADTLPRESVKDSGVTQMGAGYEVFLKGPALHALKGLAGRFASIGVHLALLLVMSGGTLDAASTSGEDVTVPKGLDSVVGSGVLSTPSDASSNEVRVNRVYMDYDESGKVSQFHTDISLFDLNGKEVLRKTISVNDPLRSTLARDLQSNVLYDEEGKFAGVRRPNLNLPIEIDGSKIVVVDAIGNSEIDPGVPIVYAGFGSLILSTCISYLSHAQLSTLQDGKTVVVGGKTNQAKGESSDKGDSSIDQVPELVESSSTEESDSFIGFRIQLGIWNNKDFDM
ncbi:cytochrome c biogenesis protein CCS1, chloroplastic-like [Lycium barbarum]|uniref:cytochrome c biogenesis protein CCS1, chloroplastic-like n=1 Tax=Lycium barbarum TaxID=112863 RepID=UPI00293E72ED|nr:cytochrome c biogenesis protein CCS1, chloroplastic-like [Lycium barbarum]